MFNGNVLLFNGLRRLIGESYKSVRYLFRRTMIRVIMDTFLARIQTRTSKVWGRVCLAPWCFC